MTAKFSRRLAQLAVIVMLAGASAACETISNLDPTGLLSDDSAPSPDSAAASPDLANVPGAPTTSDDQRQVASSLAADGARTQYSADALRAGTEPAAPAPGAAAAPVTQQALAAPPSANDAPPSADAPPTAGAPIAVASDAPPSAKPAPAQVAAAAPPPPAATSSSAPIPVTSAPAAPAATPAPVRTAALAPPPSAAAPLPPGAEPAVPAVPPAGAIRSNMLATPAMSDAALGFRPSSAPPLDASVRNFVSAPILSRYRQTASLAGSSGTMSATAAVPGRGGPEMSGAVVANLDAQPGANVIAAMNGGNPPTAVVYFPGDGTTLSAAARTQVRNAVAAYKAGGGAGTVRVVGHAASRTSNMPVEKHLEVIFEKSQKRASAVAQELIHQGIPADKVLIEAVGDSQPVYYESMPKGEDGNRRAEIYVQS